MQSCFSFFPRTVFTSTAPILLTICKGLISTPDILDNNLARPGGAAVLLLSIFKQNYAFIDHTNTFIVLLEEQVCLSIFNENYIKLMGYC